MSPNEGNSVQLNHSSQLVPTFSSLEKRFLAVCTTVHTMAAPCTPDSQDQLHTALGNVCLVPFAAFPYGSSMEMQRPVTQQDLVSRLLQDGELSLSDAVVSHVLSIPVWHDSPQLINILPQLTDVWELLRKGLCAVVIFTLFRWAAQCYKKQHTRSKLQQLCN